ncbi:MAG: DUF4244 domain-containing protein [Actinomycetales bacterium]
MDEIRSRGIGRTRLAMKAALHRIRHDERGMTTAEYAVGTVAAVGLGGLLIKLLVSDEMRQLLWTIIAAVLTPFVH